MLCKVGVLQVEYKVTRTCRMMIVTCIIMNKIQINPYGLWEVEIEMSHMHCMN